MSKKDLAPQTSGTSGGWPLIHSFQTELNRMFERFNSGPLGFEPKLMPAIDIADSDDAVEITAEIPGVKPEDLEVSIVGDTVVLKGKKSEAHEDRRKDWYHVERSFGSFRRQVPLGFSPKDGKVDATFEGGVLTLKIAKPASVAESTRKIEVAVK